MTLNKFPTLAESLAERPSDNQRATPEAHEAVQNLLYWMGTACTYETRARYTAAVIWRMFESRSAFGLTYAQHQNMTPCLRQMLPLERRTVMRKRPEYGEAGLFLDTVRLFSKAKALDASKCVHKHTGKGVLTYIQHPGGYEAGKQAFITALAKYAVAHRNQYL